MARWLVSFLFACLLLCGRNFSTTRGSSTRAASTTRRTTRAGSGGCATRASGLPAASPRSSSRCASSSSRTPGTRKERGRGRRGISRANARIFYMFAYSRSLHFLVHSASLDVKAIAVPVTLLRLLLVLLVSFCCSA